MEQTLGKRIVFHRKRLGLTQDQLAEQLGVTAQAVSKWENDQSCPDISVLPRLADIFGISTDTLLGRITPTAAPIAATEDPSSADHTATRGSDSWDIPHSSQKKGALGLAILLLSVGVLYLLSRLLTWNITFWDILWPTTLLVFGLLSMISKFSFFSLGCTLAGAYFLVRTLIPMDFAVDTGLLLAVLVVYFGISLLVDTLRRPKSSWFHMVSHDGKAVSKNCYEPSQTSFRYNGSFGENHQPVVLPKLDWGEINTSFGEYTLDFSGVETLGDNAHIRASCSFGQLNLLMPRRYAVKPVTSTAFAGFTIEGSPEDIPEAFLCLNAQVSFGEIKLIYV